MKYSSILNISIHILYTVTRIFSQGVDRENLGTDRELFWLVIISFILVTLMCDSGVKL